MRYHNISELDSRIEKIITKTVKSYYTDWKNYDRPKYMKLKGSNKQEDRIAVLIARKCGTYILTLDEIKTSTGARTIYEYFYQQEATSSDYYLINLDRLEIGKINQPDIYIKAIA